MSIRAALLVLMLPLLAGCPPRASGDDDDASDDGNWNLEIVNETGNTMETVRHRPCPSEDDEDWNEIALPPGGLEADGGVVRTTLPQPGCFDLSAQGEGCFADGTTDPMQIGDVVTWTISEDDLTCQG